MKSSRAPISAAPNPSGIFRDAAMAVVRAVLVLIFGNPLASLFARLDALLAAFRAGKLTPIAPREVSPPRPVAAPRANRQEFRIRRPAAPRQAPPPRALPVIYHPAGFGHRRARPVPRPAPVPQPDFFSKTALAPRHNCAHFIPLSK